jgi:hypothetical protein
MKELPQTLFDVYALALPAGLAFGNDLPCGAWTSGNDETLGVLTRNDVNGTYGCLVMRRRVDNVWTTLKREVGIPGEWRATEAIKPFLEGSPPREPIPSGIRRRAPLWDTEGVEPSNIFQSLAQPSRRIGAWMLNQLYLAMPNPDQNWVRDCQTENFHTRLWEACLLACFREQGLKVEQEFPSPDFRISNRAGGEAWVEAVTTNPPVRYEHYGAEPSDAPEDRKEKLIGPAAVRYAKTIRSKLQKEYHLMPHVRGKPFALAVADYHAPSSMVWSREALPCYLYGQFPKVVEIDGEQVAVEEEVKVLLGAEGIPAGLFCSDQYSYLSAILFSNGCTLPKLSRVGISAGAAEKEYRYVRIGEFYDRTPGALVGIPFCMDVASQEYKDLWQPYGYEPWSAELEVYHNPYASYPIPDALLPEATHWRMIDGEGICRAFYRYSILRSRTLVQKASDPMPTLDQILGKRDAT